MNYQLRLEEIIKSLAGKTPKLLLHACCAPCSSYCIEYLSNFFEITILYYNPNIYPSEEYDRRVNELEIFIPKRKYKNQIHLVKDTYQPKEYYEAVRGLENLGEKSQRCYSCYKLRMERAALYAKENNYDYFTTTLSISPYKVCEWINEIGESLESKYGVKYLFSDFKKNNGYKRSQELSKIYGLYRQDYCGCSFSKKEREDYEKNKLDKLFSDVVSMYGLEKLVNNPKQNTIGITNKIYELDTIKGKYILKILSKKNTDIIEKSEKIADIAKDNGLSSETAIKLNDKYVNNINGYNVILYPFYDGVILQSKELSLEHIKLAANFLANLHNIPISETFSTKIYEKNDFKKLYKLSLNYDDSFYNTFKKNIDKIVNIYDEVYNSYLKLSNQMAYTHKDFNRKNILWKNLEYKVIDWETACVSNPSIDFFNSAWFLTNDIDEEKFKVFAKEYLNIINLKDDYETAIKASLIEECNWLAFSLKRALRLVTNNGYEIKLGEESIESSLTEIINYYNKIELMIKLLNNL